MVDSKNDKQVDKPKYNADCNAENSGWVLR